MLVGGDRETMRLQCESCRAHALIRAEDYRALVADSDDHMRCGVCGAHGRFLPTEPTERERPALVSR